MAEDQVSGEVIREINIITYTVFNDDNDPSFQNHTQGHPVLKRKHNEAEYMDLTEDIEDFQIISHSPPNYKLQLTTRTASQGDYVEGESDKYKRSELLVDFKIRNYLESACLAPETPTGISIDGLDASSPCEIHGRQARDVDGYLDATQLPWIPPPRRAGQCARRVSGGLGQMRGR